MKRIFIVITLIMISVSIYATDFRFVAKNAEGDIRIFSITDIFYTFQDQESTVLEQGMMYGHNTSRREFKFKNNDTGETRLVYFDVNELQTSGTLKYLDTGEEFVLSKIIENEVPEPESEPDVSVEEKIQELTKKYTKYARPHSLMGAHYVEDRDIIFIFDSTDKTYYAIINTNTGDVIESGEWDMAMGTLWFGEYEYEVERTGTWTMRFNVKDSDEYLTLINMSARVENYGGK